LATFLQRVEESYVSTNPYHSHIHGADMCNSFTFLASRSNIWKNAEIGDTTRIACLIAALGHDMGHFAKTNLFLAASRHPLAVTYNDRSVLENMHASCLQRMLQEDDCNLFSQMTTDRIQQARQLMITLILGTDSSKHLAELSAFRMRLGADSFNPTSDASDQQITLGIIFRAADIGHSAKAWHLHEVWSYRVTQEFHEQGDEEKRLGLAVSPLCDRDNFDMSGSQSGFLQYVCIPTWKELANLETHILNNSGTSQQGTVPQTPCNQLPVRSRSSEQTYVSRAASVDLTKVVPGDGATNGQQTKRKSFNNKSRTSLFSPKFNTSVDSVAEQLPAEIEPTLARVCVAHCESNLEQWRNKRKDVQDPHNLE